MAEQSGIPNSTIFRRAYGTTIRANRKPTVSPLLLGVTLSRTAQRL
jgi:hypothetical protein